MALCRRTSILTAEDIDTIGRYSQKAAVSAPMPPISMTMRRCTITRRRVAHALGRGMDYNTAIDVMFIFGICTM